LCHTLSFLFRKRNELQARRWAPRRRSMSVASCSGCTAPQCVAASARRPPSAQTVHTATCDLRRSRHQNLCSLQPACARRLRSRLLHQHVCSVAELEAPAAPRSAPAGNGHSALPHDAPGAPGTTYASGKVVKVHLVLALGSVCVAASAVHKRRCPLATSATFQLLRTSTTASRHSRTGC
jgi:hypothetical protein